MSERKHPISAVLITQDCADHIEPCLRSLAFADEIVVVDSGSSDATCAVAEQYQARVIHQRWLGFGPQKQFAIEQARYDWVLCIDADERVSKPLRQAIVEVLQVRVPPYLVYEMPRCNRFMGRWLRHGEGYPDYNVRFFHRRHARWSEDLVHEHVQTSLDVGRLSGDLLHESQQSLHAYLQKQNDYTSLQAQQLIASGKPVGWSRALLSPWFRFVKFYLLRRGCLDGFPGLVHILIGCMNSFLKYAKVIEHTRQQKHLTRE